MSAKVTKSTKRKSKSKIGSKNLALSSRIKLRYAAPIIAVIVLVGGFVIYRSFAATRPALCASGSKDIGYNFGFKNGVGYQIRLCRISSFKSLGSEDGGSVRVSSTSSRNWVALNSAAQKAGYDLVADSSFRSHSKQTELYNCYISGRCKNLTAKPGYSNHQSGNAIDIDIVPGPNNDPSLTTCKNNPKAYPVYNWLQTHGYKYNRKAGIASECWHWSDTGY